MELDDDRVGTVHTNLERSVDRYNPQMVFILVNSSKKDLYSTIKKLLTAQRGIASQVITDRTLRKDHRTIATKIAIQINAKLGGTPWKIKIPYKSALIIGYDVCHDTNDKSKSFGAMVAMMVSGDHQSYFSTVHGHKDGTEISKYFNLNIIQCVKAYSKWNKGEIPDRIFIYRDGVGEGQLASVVEQEVNPVEKQLKELYDQNKKLDKFSFNFVVVNKRINTKLFLKKTSGMRDPRNLNVPPGTCVDDVITHPERFDFFLVSQKGMHGTLTPTYYNVLKYDKIQPDFVQRITFRLCHCYYNWSGTTKVPSVVQYAHKLAFQISQFIHQSPSTRVGDTLHFL